MDLIYVVKRCQLTVASRDTTKNEKNANKEM